MADGKIVITGSNEGAIKANQELIKENQKLEKSYETLKRKSIEAAKGSQQASKETLKDLKDLRTAQEVYVDRVRKYRQELEQGLITEKQYQQLRAKAAADVKRVTAATKEATTETTKNTQALSQNNSIGTKNTSMFAGLGKSILAYGASVISVTALVRIFNAELEKQEQLRQKSRDVTITAEEGLQRARANFVADNTVTAAQFDDKVRKAAAEAKVPVADFATALGDTLSAKGDLSNELAFRTTQAAFEASPNKELFAARELGQSAGDFMKLGGSQSPEAAIGFLAQMQQSARITNIAQLGQAAFPATQAAVQRGASIEQGAELFTTLNNLIGDAEGRVSSTAAIALVEQLADFEVTTGKGKNKVVSKPLEGIAGGPAAQIAFLQQNPELAGQFLANTSFEKKALPGVRSLITGDARGLAAQQTVGQKIGSLDAAADPQNVQAFLAYTEFLKGTGTAGGVVKAAAGQRGVNEEMLMNDAARSIIADIENTVAQTIENVDLPGPDFITGKALRTRMSLAAQVAAGQSPLAKGVPEVPEVALKEATEILRGQLLGQTRQEGAGGVVTYFNDPKKDSVKSEKEREFIEQQLKVLESLDQQIKLLRQEQKEQQIDLGLAIRGDKANPANKLNRNGGGN